jgi:hypothetical protein
VHVFVRGIGEGHVHVFVRGIGEGHVHVFQVNR